MSKDNLKMYLITVVLKPKNRGIMTFKAKTMNGISRAANPTDAKLMVRQLFLDSVTGQNLNPPLSDDEIIIKSCKLYNDFYITIK